MSYKEQPTSKIKKMFDYYSSASFVDQILTILEQTVKTFPDPKKIIECKDAESGCDKLILKCTRSNLDKCKWRVSVPSSPTKIEVNENIFTLDDIFNPKAQSSREKMRRLKQKELDEVLGLCRPDNSCEPKTIKNDAEPKMPTKSTPCLSNYKISFRKYMAKMAGFEKFRSNNGRKQNKINFSSKKINEAVGWSNNIPKNSIIVTTKNSTALKRNFNNKSFCAQKRKESSTIDDVKLPFKKCRLAKEKTSLTKRDESTSYGSKLPKKELKG